MVIVLVLVLVFVFLVTSTVYMVRFLVHHNYFLLDFLLGFNLDFGLTLGLVGLVMFLVLLMMLGLVASLRLLICRYRYRSTVSVSVSVSVSFLISLSISVLALVPGFDLGLCGFVSPSPMIRVVRSVFSTIRLLVSFSVMAFLPFPSSLFTSASIPAPVFGSLYLIVFFLCTGMLIPPAACLGSPSWASSSS